MPVDGCFGRSAGSLVRGEAVGAELAELLDVITLPYIWPLRSRGSGRGRGGVVIGLARFTLRRLSRPGCVGLVRGGQALDSDRKDHPPDLGEGLVAHRLP